METKKPTATEVIPVPEVKNDAAVDAVKGETRWKTFRTILGKGVEVTADTVNFGLQSTGYLLGAGGRAIVDGAMALKRGAKKESFNQAA